MAKTELLLLLVTASLIQALPDGPPLESCEHMQPGTRIGEIGLEGHTTSSQNLNPTYGNSKIPPYNITISPWTYQYTPGESYNIYITANQTLSANSYKGIILQARRVICASNTTVEVEEEPYGTFTLPQSSDTLLQTIECTHAASTIGHKSPQIKVNETATWRAPNEYVGHLVFRATIVQTATVYWTDLHSTVMIDPTVPMHPTCTGCFSSKPSVFVMMLTIVMVFWH